MRECTTRDKDEMRLAIVMCDHALRCQAELYRIMKYFVWKSWTLLINIWNIFEENTKCLMGY